MLCAYSMSSITSRRCWGGAQGWIHQGFYGKPKAVGLDNYDRRLAKRDARIKEEERVKQEARMGPKKGWFLMSHR